MLSKPEDNGFINNYLTEALHAFTFKTTIEIQS